MIQSNQTTNSLILNKNIEKIDVEDLIKDFRICNLDNLTVYLKELWKDLSHRSDNKKLGINKITFSKFYDVPGIIGDRLFAVFDKNANDYLDLAEFVEGMSMLFSESFVNLAKFIFEIYDFDKDGLISKEDVRVVLSYIPLNIKNCGEKGNHYKDIIESQDELHVLIEKSFNGEDFLDFKGFFAVAENISSDIILYILIFLLEKRPFSKKTLEEFENTRKISINRLTKTPNVMTSRILVASPNMNSKFSPSLTIKHSPFMSQKNLLANSLKFASSNKHANLLNKLGGKNTDLSGGNSNRENITSMDSKINTCANLSMIPSTLDIDSMNRVHRYSKSKNTNLDANIPEEKSIKTSQGTDNTLYVDENALIKNVPVFKKHRNNLKQLDTLEGTNLTTFHGLSQVDKSPNEDSLLKEDLSPAFKYMFNKELKEKLISQECLLGNSCTNDIESIEDDSDEECEEVSNEGYLYKISRGKKLKKQYFKQIHKDLYYYRNKGDLHHNGLHNLSGTFIQENQPLQFNEFYFYSFSIIFQKKSRLYYCESEDEYTNWLKVIRKVTGYANLTDIYEIKENLGKGKFGLVRLGIKKNTREKVAIKIMHKKEMSTKDLELVRTEIEILKICQHPFIIKLYDVFENPEYIYLIMEYCPGGDLFSYLEKRNFLIPESRAASLVHKLLTAVYYMHCFGIAHRDIKPENIMMTDIKDESDIRILDFGLSKIIGPNETCDEPYGTLCYVAPEVLLELPYDKSVDIWSLGIVSYLLLTGCLPFDDENSQKEVARKTIQDNVPFPNYLWKTLSIEAKDFIINLLQKDPQKRMSIKEALEHSWIQKYNKSILPEIRKKCKDLNNFSKFKIYTCVDDYNN